MESSSRENQDSWRYDHICEREKTRVRCVRSQRGTAARVFTERKTVDRLCEPVHDEPTSLLKCSLFGRGESGSTKIQFCLKLWSVEDSKIR